jgi:hypothetical protein
MASLDDILTTQKNGVVALNNLALSTFNQYTYLKGQTLTRGEANTSGYAILFTVPSTQQMTITDIEICNTGSSAASFYVSFVPSGGTAGANNAIFYNAPIKGYTTVQWLGTTVLAAGSTVQAYASSNSVSITISGGPGA